VSATQKSCADLVEIAPAYLRISDTLGDGGWTAADKTGIANDRIPVVESQASAQVCARGGELNGAGVSFCPIRRIWGSERPDPTL
jgi:hypothetical protein